MNPYGMLHSQNSLGLHHDHNHLSRMLQIPVPQQLITPTITNSAMRALGSISQQSNSLMNGSNLSMGGNSVPPDHENRMAVNPVTLDHHHSRTNPGTSGNAPPDITRQNPQQSSSSTTLELHPDIVLDNFFEEPDDRPHVCQVCNACYKTRTHLKRHMCVHLKARPYTCSYPECGKGFNRKGTEHLNKHQDAVHRLSKFKCIHCSKEISRKDHLNRHIKNMHTFPLPPGGTRRGQGGGSRRKKGTANSSRQPNSQTSVEAKVETNRFQMNSSNALGTPSEQHYHHNEFPTGKNPPVAPGPGLLELFTCAECSASFVSENDLAIHTKTHKPQPYKCSECSRAYTRREKLSEHVRCFHQGQKFTCEYCGKDLSRKDHVLRHVRSVHPEVLASQFVEMAESNGVDPASVINARSNGSNSVPSTSSSSPSTGSNNSIPSMGEMGALLKSVCHICLKVFGTSYHLARHVQSVHNQNMRPYSCSFCSKQFKRKDHLTNHMKSHCPTHREESPSSVPNPLVNPLDMNNLLTANGADSIRQHAINSLQIEMLTPEDENRSSETGGNKNERSQEGVSRRMTKAESSDDSERSDLKFFKDEKEERRSCDVMTASSHGQNQSHLVKRPKDPQQSQFKGSLKEEGGMNSAEMSGGRRSVDERSPSHQNFCGHCQLKFNSEEDLVHHLQKHGQENNGEKNSFHQNLWGRPESMQNPQPHHHNHRS